MSSKRPLSCPRFIPNPLIKKRNLLWTLEDTPRKKPRAPDKPSKESTTGPTTAQVESGDAAVPEHASSHFASTLAAYALPSIPKIPISVYQNLYDANAGSLTGSHFVIHQHDHPIAGTHYDLRLQINETSSVSWAIMYGLPGNANSIRQNRNATETRIHCLWNHLIETASSATGSLLIWDTGTYTILPRKSKHDPEIDPSSQPSSPPPASPLKTQQELLHEAFQNRKIRLRLHGAKLPDPYVVNLRLTKSEDASGRAKSARSIASGRKRRRRGRDGGKAAAETPLEETSDEEDTDIVPSNGEQPPKPDDAENISAMEREIRELEDDHVRKTNAYPGASNTIGSIHQRRWYLSLDRSACGFVESHKKVWRPNVEETKDSDTPKEDETIGASLKRSAYPFFVRGADHERSVVTGRLGQDILQDEGVRDFFQRTGWKPVLN